MLILKNARLIPELTEGFDGVCADVVIEDDIITEIRQAGDPSVSAADTAATDTAATDTAGTDAAAQTIDLKGKTLIPGLIEAHLHLDLCGKNTFEENTEPDSYRIMRCLKLAQDNLKQGYTTVRDVGDRSNITIGMARAVNEGMVMGPDILTSGMIISPTEKGNDFFGDMYAEADSKDAFTKAVRRQYQLGADWIKIMGTGAVMNPGGEPGMPIIFEEELAAAVRAADYVGLPVAVHCHGTEGIKMCIRCGVRTIEHSSIMDEECIKMYQASDRSYPIPTLSPLVNFIEEPEDKPAHYVEKARRLVESVIWGLHAYKENGVKIGWGTDAGVYEGSHGNGIYEFRARVNLAGFTPLETLIQATKNNAEILMIDDKVGTIACGKRANLAAFDGNPDEDIEALTKVALVVKAGEIVNL